MGKFKWFGCAGHHLNLVAQAGFKKVESAAMLVRRAKKCVEFIKSSIPASYLLKDYQEQFELSLHKLLQENNTRWWSILLMFISLKENKEALTLTLDAKDKRYLMLISVEWIRINQIIQLFEPFKIAGEMLGSKKNISISLIIPAFQILKDGS